MTISINEEYKVARRNAESLSIPFRNQNLIHLVNEAFNVYREDDRMQSTFNARAKDVFFHHIKRPFDHTFYVPDASASSMSYDIQKCHSACLGTKDACQRSAYCVFDEVRGYSGSMQESFCYVETENYFPLRGNSWYLMGILKFAA